MGEENSSQTVQPRIHHDTLTDLIGALDIDEGCVIENEEARDVLSGDATAPQAPILINAPGEMDEEMMRAQSLVLNIQSKDSGLSSRMSEADGGETNEKAARALLLGASEDGVLSRRLARISECQYEEPCRCSPSAGLKATVKVVGVGCLLYIFICTLDLLGNAFKLLGGKTAGSVFSDSELLLNPITGLMIGVMATVLLQSSSTSSSIVITMVASNILPIQPAIFIIMGANIGTTVTNTLVSLAHSMDRKEFRRAFSGAVVHDVFNWLTVLILLPLEYCTGYLYLLTDVIIDSMNMESMKAKKQDLLKKLTKPLTSRIVQVDKNVITGIAENKKGYANKTLLKEYCVFEKEEQYVLVNTTTSDNITGTTWSMVNTSVQVKIPKEKCQGLLNQLAWSDKTAGALLFILSILLLSLCLYLMVKLLHSLLGGQIAKAARKTINADFPSPFHWLTGYAAIIVGAGLTILVQSSSVFTSALTPLVGVGCLKLERMFPLTLGSNIGTTFTGILAALAAPPETMSIALQLAFCHLFFNISGILIFYPVPKMRRIVLQTAKYLGRTTATYRWFAVAYLIFMFILFPVFFFSVSLAGKVAFIVMLCIVGTLSLSILVINIMQRYKSLRNYLPPLLRTWEFLPECLRSLAPVDRLFRKMFSPFTKCCCQCCLNKCACLMASEVDMGSIDSDSEDDSDSAETSVASSKMFLSKSKPKYADRIFKPKTIGFRPSTGNRSPVQERAKLTTNGMARNETVTTLLPDPSRQPSPVSDSKRTLNLSDISVHSGNSDSGASTGNTSTDSKTPLTKDYDDQYCDHNPVDINTLSESKI